jgi:hypothetical protein
MNPTKTLGWTQVLRMCKQFLRHCWHPSRYSHYKPGYEWGKNLISMKSAPIATQVVISIPVCVVFIGGLQRVLNTTEPNPKSSSGTETFNGLLFCFYHSSIGKYLMDRTIPIYRTDEVDKCVRDIRKARHYLESEFCNFISRFLVGLALCCLSLHLLVIITTLISSNSSWNP